jgi:hypothetical protein
MNKEFIIRSIMAESMKKSISPNTTEDRNKENNMKVIGIITTFQFIIQI